MEGEVVTKDKVRKAQSPDCENQTRCRQKPRTGNQRSEKQMSRGGSKQGSKGVEPKKLTKWVTGVRKIWGTGKKESCDDIAY